jgi:hypothetical protein
MNEHDGIKYNPDFSLHYLLIENNYTVVLDIEMKRRLLQ